jgi:hypothetical protein|tara:strand:- start:163 stop:423 length:261 start_codon:yes stop_codon:yes gene_type:complete
LTALAIFPIYIQPIFFGYLLALSGAIYISTKNKNAAINLYVAFISRWSIFIIFSILSLVYIPNNPLIAVFLLVYLNSTFNPKTVTA